MSRGQIFLYSILSCLILICIVDDSEELPGLTIKKLQACPKYPKALAKLSNIKLKKVKENMLISYTGVISRDITNDLEVQAVLTRCAASEALDTCERMRPFTIKNFCRFFNIDKTPWSSFLNSLKPHVTCPIKKGTYVLKDAEVSSGDFGRFPFASGFYKFEFIMKDQGNGDVITCVYVEATLNP
ncbi:unnamed protein product [Acanthoscelides obtectus]|uniref:MD-2-related lipid-recognition domain-containing protein n=2 Tax=Acanthoscelides obtectus TaxID=200917 RepID=A0A9P0KAU3_ACAOB|nr:unnamed protein product [Acanthoscelides obtectus]CAK1629402.1 hypothetical protein AOBTE_LOCUS5721 [Acanthoscelides obtectus]